MAAILLDNIINQTIHNSIFQGSSVVKGDHDQDELLAGSAGSIRNAASKLQLEREDRILTNSLTQDNQLDSLTQSLQNVDMGQYERAFWILLFAVMVLVAAGGNIAVVYIVSTNKEMKSVTNYFLVNLSLADTMVSTLNVVFNFTSMLISHWPFGKVYCKISNFIAILSISASVFTLTAISCDRYNAILHPLRPRMSHSHALLWVLLIWTLSSALAMPNVIYSNLVDDRLANDNVAITCTMIWPDGRYPLSSYDHIYNIIILVVTYLVPILTMAILYYRVGKELWGYEAIGENIDKQQRSIMAKKKIVKMMIVVVIIFALCWLPYHAFFVVNYYVPTIFQDMPLHYQRCYLIMYWMAMSNSMYNPIIIYFMNSKFRHEFRKILCILCCWRAYVPPTATTTRTTHTEINNYNAATNTNHKQNNNYATSNNNNNNNNDRTSGIRQFSSQMTKRQKNFSELTQTRAVERIDDNQNNNDRHKEENSITEEAQETNDNDKVRIVVTERIAAGPNMGCSSDGNKSAEVRGGRPTARNQSSDMATKPIVGSDTETEPFIVAMASASGAPIANANNNDLNSATNVKLIDLAGKDARNVRRSPPADGRVESSNLRVWI